jgi:hypothetical protein
MRKPPPKIPVPLLVPEKKLSPEQQTTLAALPMIEQQTHALLSPDSMLTPDYMRALLNMVLLICYDRKVEREFYAEVADRVTYGFTLLRGMECGVITLRHTRSIPEATQQVLVDAVNKTSKELTELRVWLCEKLLLLNQCAHPEERIN